MTSSRRIQGKNLEFRRNARILLVVFLLASLAPGAIAADAGPDGDEDPGIVQRFRAWRLERIAAIDAYLIVSPTSTYVNLQDTRMTPLIYSGFGFGGVIQDLVIHPKLLALTTVTARYASPSVPEVLPGIYQNITAELDMAYLYRVPVGSTVGSGLAVGGGVSGGINTRSYDKLQNSSLNFDIVASINAGVRWDMTFTLLRRSVTWFVTGRTPLFSYVGRYPEYTLGGVRSYWLAPWKFARITVETGLGTNLRWSKENRIQLSYAWEFNALNEFDGIHLLRIGTHQLALGLATKRM